MSDIIFKYGVEIEFAFNMVNIIDYFIKNSEQYINLNIILFNSQINDIFEELFKIKNFKDIIDIDTEYKTIKKIRDLKYSDNTYYEIIKEQINTNELKIKIKNEFISLLDNIFNYIKKNNYSDNSSSFAEFIFKTFKINNHNMFKLLIKYINNIYTNIVIYNDDINKLLPFYDESLNYIMPNLDDDKIYLTLIRDNSVICSDLLYYTINNINNNILDNYLLNKCECISQVFTSTDDVKNKLSILFSNVNKLFINCPKTSNHVHISFNEGNKVIIPNINHIVFITALCYIIQDDIMDYVLYFRKNNDYCKLLNFKNIKEKFKSDDNLYNDNIKLLLKIFFNENYSDERYYWINLMNLFKDNYTSNRPPTIEFRLKHGSNDAEEISNFCKLYEMIIKYGIKLSESFMKSEYDINEVIKYILQNYTRESLKTSNKQKLNYLELILSKDKILTDYFKNQKKIIKIANKKLINYNISENYCQKGSKIELYDILELKIDSKPKFITNGKSKSITGGKPELSTDNSSLNYLDKLIKEFFELSKEDTLKFNKILDDNGVLFSYVLNQTKDYIIDVDIYVHKNKLKKFLASFEKFNVNIIDIKLTLEDESYLYENKILQQILFKVPYSFDKKITILVVDDITSFDEIRSNFLFNIMNAYYDKKIYKNSHGNNILDIKKSYTIGYNNRIIPYVYNKIQIYENNGYVININIIESSFSVKISNNDEYIIKTILNNIFNIYENKNIYNHDDNTEENFFYLSNKLDFLNFFNKYNYSKFIEDLKILLNNKIDVRRLIFNTIKYILINIFTIEINQLNFDKVKIKTHKNIFIQFIVAHKLFMFDHYDYVDLVEYDFSKIITKKLKLGSVYNDSNDDYSKDDDSDDSDDSDDYTSYNSLYLHLNNNINITKQKINFFKKYITENNDNIILVLNDNNIIHITKKELDKYVSKINDNWLFNCTDISKIKKLMEKPYIKLPQSVGTNIFVSYNDLYNLFISNAQIFFLNKKISIEQSQSLKNIIIRYKKINKEKYYELDIPSLSRSQRSLGGLSQFKPNTNKDFLLKSQQEISYYKRTSFGYAYIGNKLPDDLKDIKENELIEYGIIIKKIKTKKKFYL